MKGIGIFLSLEITEVLPPGGPTACEPFKHLSGVTFSSQLRLAVRPDNRIPLLISLRHSGFPEIFLGENIDRELRPGLGNVDVFQLKHCRSVGITNFRRTFHERLAVIGTLPATCKSAFYSHDFPSPSPRGWCGTGLDPKQEQSGFNINRAMCLEHPNLGSLTDQATQGVSTYSDLDKLSILNVVVWLGKQRKPCG